MAKENEAIAPLNHFLNPPLLFVAEKVSPRDDDVMDHMGAVEDIPKPLDSSTISFFSSVLHVQES